MLKIEKNDSLICQNIMNIDDTEIFNIRVKLEMSKNGYYELSEFASSRSLNMHIEVSRCNDTKFNTSFRLYNRTFYFSS